MSFSWERTGELYPDCLTTLAKNETNQYYCELIDEESDKIECLNRLGIHTGNVSLCVGPAQDRDKVTCRAVTTLKQTLDQIEPVTMQDPCDDSMFRETYQTYCENRSVL